MLLHKISCYHGYHELPSGNIHVAGCAEEIGMRDLSIIMPCLNEAETLGDCILKAQQSIEALKLDGEIIVADNGSTDGSMAIAQDLGARVVHIKEKGYGNALRGGIEAAAGKWIVMADADDSYDLSYITFTSRFADYFGLDGTVARLVPGEP